VGFVDIAASWVVTRCHVIADRHGHVRATEETGKTRSNGSPSEVAGAITQGIGGLHARRGGGERTRSSWFTVRTTSARTSAATLVRHLGALGAREEDPMQVEALLKLTEKVILDGYDRRTPPLRPTAARLAASGRRPRAGCGRTKGMLRHARRLASGNMVVLLDALMRTLMRRLGEGRLTNASPRPRSEEEGDRRRRRRRGRAKRPISQSWRESVAGRSVASLTPQARVRASGHSPFTSSPNDSRIQAEDPISRAKVRALSREKGVHAGILGLAAHPQHVIEPSVLAHPSCDFRRELCSGSIVACRNGRIRPNRAARSLNWSGAGERFGRCCNRCDDRHHQSR
jgi:hypothetical protein